MTITYGTQKQVDTSGDRVNIINLTSTTAIGFYSSVTGGLQARHLTLSAGVITVGPELTIDAASSTTNHVRSAFLTSTSVLIAYAYGGTTHDARVITVSGTTLTANAILNLTDLVSTGTFTSLDTLSSTACIYAYKDNSDNGVARVLSISGTTVTEGAAFQFDATGAFNISVAALSATKAVVCFIDNNNSQRPTGEVLNISGTTITGNADVQLSTTAGITTLTHNLMVRAIDSSKLLVCWVQDATQRMYGLVLTESSNTLTVGSLWTISIGAAGAYRDVSVSINSASKATASSKTNASAGSVIIVELSISGTTLTEVDIDSSGVTGSGIRDQWTTNLNSTTSLCIWDGTTEAIAIFVTADTTLSTAAMTKPADIDAAGEFIYVALLEGTTPILTKISTALDADGTTVFDPGAGDNIGVECGRFSSDTVWVAGNFDGTNVVEKSEDGGSTFAVKDDGTIGDVRTFVMGPDSDERILVFDETNGDILETNDDGASWTAINAAVTPEVNAIARLGENVQESVFGNDGGANNSINYSVNSGGNLEDFQTGVYPNANATRVIVN